MGRTPRSSFQSWSRLSTTPTSCWDRDGCRAAASSNWPKSRELLSRGANLYTRLALGIDLHDATGGYRAYRRAVLDTIDYEAVVSVGYCFQVDLVWRAVRAGFRVVEVPITFAERERGESKMSGSIVREALWRVTEWGARHRAQQVADLLRRRH